MHFALDVHRMGVVFRQSAKNVLVTGAGAMLGALVMLLSSQYLPQRGFGFVTSITNYAVIASQLLLLGLNATLVVFVHKYATDPGKKRLLLSICLIVPAVVTLIGSILYYFLKDWVLHHFQPADVPMMDRYFLWLPLFTLLFVYLVILEQYLGSQLKVAISAFMREVALRVLNISLIVLFATGIITFHMLVLGTILIYLVPVLIFLFLASRTDHFGLSFDFSGFSIKEYKEIFHFSWYHFLLTISVLLITNMDALLLPFYDHSGFKAGAVYRIAVYLISFLLLPLKAMMPASFTVLAKAFADKDIPKATDLFLRASVNIFIPTVGIGMLLCCNLDNISLMLKDGYQEMMPVFLILFAGNLVNIATGMNDQVLSITNYYKFNFYLSFLLILVLFFLLRTLIPQYGLIGAALSTTITIVVFNTAKCVFVWKKLNMLPFSKSTFLTFVAAIPAFAAGWLLPRFFEILRGDYLLIITDTIMRSTVVVGIYAFMLIWLKPSKDLEEYLSNIRKNKRLF